MEEMLNTTVPTDKKNTYMSLSSMSLEKSPEYLNRGF